MTSRRNFLGIAGLAAAWPEAALPQAKPKPPKPKPEGVLVNDIHSQLNTTRVFRVMEPDSIDGVRSAFTLARKEEKPICIAGGRHAMGGQQFCTDGVLIDIRKLNKVLSFDTERGLIELESGVQWPRLYEYLVAEQAGRPKQWTFAQKQTGADRLTMGGCLSSNIHGRGLTLPPFIGDVESFRLIDAKGDLHNCSRSENPELFRLAIGGYGLFGFIYSVTLRLVPRRKLERVVVVREVNGLVGAFADRITEGYLYGDFQYAIDNKSEDFLRRGVFSCYRPAPDDAPVPATRRELSEADWVELLLLAHSDKNAAFRRYSSYYQATAGQIYWSDEQQMAIYPDNYHRDIDRRLQAPKGTEVITEIYCERDALERFMAEVRAYALRDQVEIIYGTVRLIEQDKESFLPWARKPYACVIFNVHVEHSTRGLIKAGDIFRRLIDIGLRFGGGWYPTYHKHALRRQVDFAYPQMADFLKLKRKYDAAEFFQSDWYRHYKNMFFRQ
jgi:FAD/FMN-containing dehydrogenase